MISKITTTLPKAVKNFALAGAAALAITSASAQTQPTKDSAKKTEQEFWQPSEEFLSTREGIEAYMLYLNDTSLGKGKIPASEWNLFAEDYQDVGAKKIKNYIEIENARKSISTYWNILYQRALEEAGDEAHLDLEF